jgi:hypothetical protein
MRSGEVDALLTIWMAAVRVPAAVGANDTLKVHWPFTANPVPQLLD